MANIQEYFAKKGVDEHINRLRLVAPRLLRAMNLGLLRLPKEYRDKLTEPCGGHEVPRTRQR